MSRLLSSHPAFLQEKKKEENMKKQLSDRQLFLGICVGVTIFWTYICSGLCVNDMDQLWLVVYAVGFMLLPFVMFRHRK
jgi:hypothetical protein